MSLRIQALRGAAWSATARVGSQVLSLVVFFVLARLLMPDAFGLVAMAVVLTTFMGVFLDQGFAAALVQRRDLEPQHLNTAFWTALGIAAVLWGIAWFVAGPTAAAFEEPGLVPIIRVMGAGFVLAGLRSTQEAVLRRAMAFKQLAVCGLSASVAGGTVGVTMAVWGMGAWSLVGQLLSMQATNTLVLWSVSSWRPGTAVSARHFRDLFAFGIHVLGQNLLNFFNRQSDNLLIGLFLGTVVLGYYTVAYRVLTLLSGLLVSTIAPVAFSALSRVQHDRLRLQNGYLTTTRLVVVLAFPVFLGVAVLAPEAVVVGFGEQWVPSIPVMQILMLIGLVHAAFAVNGPVLQAAGRPGWVLAMAAINATANVVLFLIVVRWGIVAVAAAYAIRGYLFIPLPLLVLRRVIGLDLKRYAKEVGRPLLAAVGMAGVLLILQRAMADATPLVRLLVSVPTGAVVYAALIFVLRPQLFAEMWGLAQSMLFSAPGRVPGQEEVSKP